MSAGEGLDLEPVGAMMTIHGEGYQLCRRGAVQLAWISRDGRVVAKVQGLVRGEPQVCEKEPGLAWPDHRDEEVAARVYRLWDEAGLLPKVVDRQ